MLTDILPAADAILCRDCLVHLSYGNIAKALRNIRASHLRWLIATTFPDHHENQDAMDGDWRLLNMEAAPFRLPPSFAMLNEGCKEGGGAYADQSLGVWRVADLPIPLNSGRPARTGSRCRSCTARSLWSHFAARATAWRKRRG